MNWWWLIVRTPDAIHVWPVWGETDQPDEALINAARVAVGFPAHDNWPDDGSGYSVALTLGEPHHTLLAQATVGTVADLSKVDPAAVQAYATARVAAGRQAQIDAAKMALMQLDPAGKAAAIAAAGA